MSSKNLPEQIRSAELCGRILAEQHLRRGTAPAEVLGRVLASVADDLPRRFKDPRRLEAILEAYRRGIAWSVARAGSGGPLSPGPPGRADGGPGEPRRSSASRCMTT